MKRSNQVRGGGQLCPPQVRYRSGQVHRITATGFLLVLSFWSWSYADQAIAGTVSAPSRLAAVGTAATPQNQRAETSQDVAAKQAALVSEFDVNGLKVLVKRREGSLTVSAGLFIRGGSRNITPDNAGIESLMLASA